jgi:hypothetical protein
MSQKTFFESEPLPLRLLYIMTFMGFLYVMYEVFFIDPKMQTQYLKEIILVFFGVFFIRKGLYQMKAEK